MAITGLQCLGEGETRRLGVLGTDINPNFLTRAREGRYGEWSYRNVQDTVRATWFSKHGKTWEVQPILKQIVRFAPLNLRVEPGVDPKDWPSRQDIIFCRNVLVYFEAEAARRTLEQLGTCLQPGGWLVTGSTDPHFANIPGLNVVHEPELIAYQRPSGRPPMLATDAERPPIERPSWVAPPVVPKREPSPPPERAEALGPPAIAAADLLGEAKAFADRGETEHAMELLEMKLHRDALDPGAYLLRASLRMSQGQPAAAADDARAAVLLDRRLAMAHVLMAVARAELGETAGARRALKSAQDLLRVMPDPEAEVVHSGGATVGQLLATCSRLKSALGDARRTGRRSPR
jgi:chemotaxis protein methyltransferase CheR